MALVRKSSIVSVVFIPVFLLISIMESFTAGYMFGNGSSTTHVVEISSPSTEIVPFEIPIGIVDRVMDNRYAGDGTVHLGEHLLYIKELCGLFKIACASRELIMRKLFSIALEERAWEWYKLLDDSHLLDWKELVPLF